MVTVDGSCLHLYQSFKETVEKHNFSPPERNVDKQGIIIRQKISEIIWVKRGVEGRRVEKKDEKEKEKRSHLALSWDVSYKPKETNKTSNGV